MSSKAVFLAAVTAFLVLVVGGCGGGSQTPNAAVRQYMGPNNHPIFFGENVPLPDGQVIVFYKLSGSTSYSVVQRQSTGWREMGSGSGFDSTSGCGWVASSYDGVTYIGGQFSSTPLPYTVHVTASHKFQTGLLEKLSMYAPVDRHGFWALRIPFISGIVPIVGLSHNGTVPCN